MTRERLSIALVSFAVLACHRTAPPARETPRVVAPVRRDTVVRPPVPPVVQAPPDVVASFADTGRTVNFPEGRDFDLRIPSQRDSLRAVLRKEREQWRAAAPRDYRFLLRVGCFCPGTKGWQIMEVRAGQLVRVWGRAGKSAPLEDWNTFSIDGLFDHLERSADRNGSVRISFDPRWHYPAYVSTVTLPGPDAWGTYEARGFRPI